MGHIKEPIGVDFIINGKPLTEKEKMAISAFIKADKEKNAKQKARRAGKSNRTKKVLV